MTQKQKRILFVAAALLCLLLTALPFIAARLQDAALQGGAIVKTDPAGLPDAALQCEYARQMYEKRQNLGTGSEECAEYFTRALPAILQRGDDLSAQLEQFGKEKQLPPGTVWTEVALPAQEMRVMQAWYAAELRLFVSFTGVPGYPVLDGYAVSVMPDELDAFLDGSGSAVQKAEYGAAQSAPEMTAEEQLSLSKAQKTITHLTALSQMALRQDEAYVMSRFFVQEPQDMPSLLYRVDAETGEAQPVCTVPDCPHTGSGCGAYLPAETVGFYDLGDLLYVVEDTAYGKSAVLMDPVTGARQTCVMQSGGEFFVKDAAAAVAGNVLWLCRPGALWRLDTVTGEAEPAYDLNAILCSLWPETEAGRFAYDCRIIGFYEDTLVIGASRTRESRLERENYFTLKQQRCCVFTLDTVSGSAQATPAAWYGFAEDYALMADGATLWVADRTQDTLLTYDLRTGEQTVLAQELGLQQYPSLSAVKAEVIGGQPVWCATTQIPVENTYHWQDTRFTWDTQKKCVTELTAQSQQKGEQRAVRIAAANEHLVCLMADSLTVGIPQTYNGQLYYQDTEVWYWRLQPAADFLKNEITGHIITVPDVHG